MTAHATRTMVVWCPDWPVTAAGFDGEQAVAVVAANRVVACSAAARADGVRRGLRRREAQARSPSIVVLEHDPDADARAFEPVVAAVAELAPRVEVVRPGVCAFATRGPSRYFGGDERLAEAVAEAAGVPCRIGVADGPFAAQLAARRGTIVAPGGSGAFLAPFPVSALERPELADLLRRLGVRTLGAFAALPPRAVLGRFGVDGEHAHRLARGLDERPLAARTPPPELIVQAELDPPAERVDAAVFATRTLAEQLTARLGELGLACTRIAIEAESEHGETLSRLWRHDGAMRAGAIAERVRWQLDGWLNGPPSVRPTAGLTLVRLVPDEVRPDTGRQLGFWGGATQADERAGRALARVQGMLGPEAVVTAVVGGGRDPADRVRFVPWGDARTPARPGSHTAIAGEAPPWPGALPAPSPAIVHADPPDAEVVGADGSVVSVSGRGAISGAPARMSIGGSRWDDVVAWAGPWPVDERWWDPAARARRARVQVVLASGSAHLLALAGSRWRVEATYD